MAIYGHDQRPVLKMAEAFVELANSVKNSSTSHAPDQEDVVQLETAPFCHACSLVSPIIGSLGIAFKFASVDFDAKVHDLFEASKSLGTLQMMVDRDVEANCWRITGSHTRNLLRVKRALDMLGVLFELMIATQENAMKNQASTAYAQVFAPYHGWAIRKAIAAGMYTVPTRAQLMKMFHEDECSARIVMQTYITALATVTEHINKIFLSRDLGLDW